MSGQVSEDTPDMAMPRALRTFTAASSDGCTARLGRLALAGRWPVETPNFIPFTSRGTVPHVTPDNITKHTSIGTAYVALEDFIEKKDPPIYKTPQGDRRPLHAFTALPSDMVMIMAPRRHPAVTAPQGNTAKSFSVFTSTGFFTLSIPEFAAAVESLQPDVVIAPADIYNTSVNPVANKLLRTAERTEAWLEEFLVHLPAERMEALGTSLFAPVLPVEHPMQWSYLKLLSEEVTDALSGLAVYDVDILPELTEYSSLAALPKLSLDIPKSPHDVLRQISLGIDLCILPFLNTASDAGIALTFKFPPPTLDSPQPMGIDMWSEDHSTSVKPLVDGCTCYTCTTHHRAFVRHLLNAKEMLGWTLLQIHNYHLLDEFFAGIRGALNSGLATFDEASKRFRLAYDPELPEGTGSRPRARGYHFKSEAGKGKINKTDWKDLNGREGESTPMSLDDGSTETPLVPDIDSNDLASQGFGQKQG